MDTTYTYITVLLDTLQKKKKVLEQISNVTKEQKKLLQSEKISEEEFQKTLRLKAMLLEELENLDKGFEQVYERVALVLKHNKDMYKEKIQTAQQLIKEVMDFSVSIQIMEEQNKERFNIVMSSKKGKMKNIKVGNRVAANYYRNMPNIHQTGQSYFLDRKN